MGSTPTGSYDATKYTYNGAGDVATVTDPVGNVWRYTYDLRGRQIKVEDPDSGTSESKFDDAGQLVSVTDGRLVTTSAKYDNAGRKTETWLGQVGTGTKLAEWKFDTIAKGQLTSSTRWESGNAYTTTVTGYDARYRPTGTSTTIPLAEGLLAGTYTTSQTYNVDGTLASTTLPAGGGLAAEKVTYGYTPQGLLNTVSGASTYLTETAYDALGRPVEAVLSDGNALMVKNFAYDVPTGRLARHLVWGDSAPDVLTDSSYTYDAAGNLTAVSDKLAQYGGVDDNQCFRHDYLRQLTEAWTPANGACAANPSTPALGGPAPYWLSYTYDKVGNRKSETKHAPGGDTVKSYAYPAAQTARPHALTSVTTTGPGAGTVTFGYDTAGHTSSRDMPAEDQTLTWDNEGRLDTVSSTTAGNTKYLYTADGDRLIRREPNRRTLYVAGQQIRTTNLGAVSGLRAYGEHAVRSTETGLAWTAADHQGSSSITVDAVDVDVPDDMKIVGLCVF